MPKHQEKNQTIAHGAHNEEITDLLERFHLSAEEKEYCMDQLAGEGPAHKQAYAALLLARIAKQVAAIEKVTGRKFVPQKGHTLAFGKHEKAEVPIQLPASVLEKGAADETIDVLSKSPGHEGVLFNLLLQAIEWSIAQTDKK